MLPRPPLTSTHVHDRIMHVGAVDTHDVHKLYPPICTHGRKMHMHHRCVHEVIPFSVDASMKECPIISIRPHFSYLFNNRWVHEFLPLLISTSTQAGGVVAEAPPEGGALASPSATTHLPALNIGYFNIVHAFFLTRESRQNTPPTHLYHSLLPIGAHAFLTLLIRRRSRSK
jgi:hypothetical protein